MLFLGVGFDNLAAFVTDSDFGALGGVETDAGRFATTSADNGDRGG